MCNNEAYPWAENPEMKDALETAGWRYFVLIGVVKPYDQFIEFFEIDKKKYPHLVCAEGVTPHWGFNSSLDFMNAITGYDKSICEQWLEFDWG